MSESGMVTTITVMSVDEARQAADEAREAKLLRQVADAYGVVDLIDAQICALADLSVRAQCGLAADHSGPVPLHHIREILQAQERELLSALTRCQLLALRLGADIGQAKPEAIAPEAALVAAGVGRERGRKGVVADVLAALQTGEGDE